jgi:hypothetical protein
MAKITDENDNLVDVEEWTETPGGNCKIEIDLDDDIPQKLIEMWVEENLEEASQELFFEEVENDPVKALWNAVVNDQLINAIRQKIEEEEHKSTHIPK